MLRCAAAGNVVEVAWSRIPGSSPKMNVPSCSSHSMCGDECLTRSLEMGPEKRSKMIRPHVQAASTFFFLLVYFHLFASLHDNFPHYHVLSLWLGLWRSQHIIT